MVREGAGTQFDEEIVEHFLRVAMPYPIGYTITLPDGTPGAVAGVDPEEPEYPVIRYRNASGNLVEAAMHIVDGVVEACPETAPHSYGDLSIEDEELEPVILRDAAWRPAA